MLAVEEMDEDLVEIGWFEDEDALHDYGLVVLSQGCPYWVDEDAGGFVLLVEAKSAERIERQLQLYEKELEYWPPEEPEMAEGGSSSAAMVWLMLMTLAYGLSYRWPSLYEQGKLSAEAVMHGEAYRVFSALFLHADLGHLAGNLLFGSVFLHLVARHIGGLRAWGLVLLAGGAGNFLNAWIYYPGAHYSVGASTAVFGAIGILVALPLGFRLRHAPRQLVRSWAIPLLAGLAFLAWFGTGDEFTDTSAHLMGFAAGLPLGVLGGWLCGRPQD